MKTSQVVATELSTSWEFFQVPGSWLMSQNLTQTTPTTYSTQPRTTDTQIEPVHLFDFVYTASA
jgi:hypothetical protein